MDQSKERVSVAKKIVWTKKCRYGIACASPLNYHQTSFIPDDQEICDYCLRALLDLRESDVCHCCGAGENSSTNDSVINAIRRILDGENIFPRYFARMWYEGDPLKDDHRNLVGIFDSNEDPETRDPVEQIVVRRRASPYNALKKMEKKAEEMNEA